MAGAHSGDLLVAGLVGWLGGATGIPLFANPGFSPALTVSGQYYVFFAIVIVLSIGAGALLRSRLGHRFQVLASSEELAASLGYSSDSAFSNAFKRRTGMAPKHYQSIFARMEGT